MLTVIEQPDLNGYNVCGCSGDWKMDSFVDTTIKALRLMYSVFLILPRTATSKQKGSPG